MSDSPEPQGLSRSPARTGGGEAASPHPISAGPALAPAVFEEIRRTMALEHCKWDSQVGDETTLAPFPLLLSRSTWERLASAAEQLAEETLACEEELCARPELHDRLALPRRLGALLRRGAPALTPGAARIMRFDFHFTTEGWRVSEVNSDVPGGLTEAESFTALVAAHTPGAAPAGAPGSALAEAIARAVGGGAVALLSAPGYMEDHQVIAYLARRLRERGLDAHLVSPHHLRWDGGGAALDTAWSTGPLSAIVRFYQAEWLARLPRRLGWERLFSGGRTPVTNPGAAALGESKRLPLLWDELHCPVRAWRELAPEAREPGEVPWRDGDRWVLKQAYSNTGDTVSMRSAMTARAWAALAWRVRLGPGAWVAQRRFEVIPVQTPLGALVPCIGVYTVDGRAAGMYGRVARGPIVNFAAIDVAVLIRDETS
jgi:glutathionylspermidine synthase